MTYHDHTLARVARTRRSVREKAWKSALRGIELITLNPPSPVIRRGSVAQDWAAVGDDLRKAMKRQRLGE